MTIRNPCSMHVHGAWFKLLMQRAAAGKKKGRKMDVLETMDQQQEPQN